MIRSDKLVERGPAREIRKAINRLQDQITSQRISPGVNYKVSRTATGTILHIAAASVSGGVVSDIAPFQIETIYPTLYKCRKVKSEMRGEYQEWSFADTTTYYVMRPEVTWINQPSTRYGGNVGSFVTDNAQCTLRTVSISPYSYKEIVYPELFEGAINAGTTGSIVYAAKLDSSCIRLVQQAGSTVLANDYKMEWLDLNVDARKWEIYEWQQVQVCVNGVTKTMLVMGSDYYPQ